MRDLPFIESIFWAFKVLDRERKGRSVKKLLKCEFQVFKFFSLITVLHGRCHNRVITGLYNFNKYF